MVSRLFKCLARIELRCQDCKTTFFFGKRVRQKPRNSKTMVIKPFPFHLIHVPSPDVL